jgi:hypothetical protein
MEDTKIDATEPKTELEPWQELSVLEDIEATNRALSEFNFINVANSVPRLYGLKNTKLHELFWLRVKYLKTLPIEKYVQWLRKYKATPSQSTQDLLLDYTANLLGNTHLSPSPSPSPSPSAPELNPAPSPKPANQTLRLTTIHYTAAAAVAIPKWTCRILSNPLRLAPQVQTDRHGCHALFTALLVLRNLAPIRQPILPV